MYSKTLSERKENWSKTTIAFFTSDVKIQQNPVCEPALKLMLLISGERQIFKNYSALH